MSLFDLWFFALADDSGTSGSGGSITKPGSSSSGGNSSSSGGSSSGESSSSGEKEEEDPYKNRVTESGEIEVTNCGRDFITISCASISKATRYIIAYRKSSESTATYIPSDYSALSNCLSYARVRNYTITGLEPGTAYVVNYCGVNATNYEAEKLGPFMDEGITCETTNRPEDWEWDTLDEMSSEHEITLTALEWNNFCDRINEFREYCGLSDYSFTIVKSGDYIEADHVNKVVAALADMADNSEFSVSDFNSYKVTANDTDITWKEYVGLMNLLNSIY